MDLNTLNAAQVAEKLQQGAVLVDIRSVNEYRAKHIVQAQSMPLDELDKLSPPSQAVVIFHCLSGMRTRQNWDKLRAFAHNAAEIYVLDGGLNAWEQAGLPVEKVANAPMDIMRQVQIAAGSLVLLGVIFGALVSPVFYVLSAFVGVGLVFAGVTGFCGMAKLLAKMPWNRF
ncbi:rhodanese family protein [Kingella negevensis]|uniref:rhodanese family protein n=1 Tax=Kingella negevensis TaxID=1522312 RepID=UPI00254AEF7C|nr:rhodanese family protein [Kingella negevensis]MDK4680283.1 rhodanese family protein [Kingella negevensis]MDK4681997.1 rhodanese family protein [Kingella negevensis]MDK4690193.1 rhodanese family protein [Kingella negevensis]MDK4692462.1 rhodanese family protein [Kingella negevensis]MDK4698763.1 rhodanese family protein [Kingella negevensis]